MKSLTRCQTVLKIWAFVFFCYRLTHSSNVVNVEESKGSFRLADCSDTPKRIPFSNVGKQRLLWLHSYIMLIALKSVSAKYIKVYTNGENCTSNSHRVRILKIFQSSWEREKLNQWIKRVSKDVFKFLKNPSPASPSFTPETSIFFLK